MANYLVTGIAGFIGSALAHALVERGHSVRGIDNLSTGSEDNLAGIRDHIDFREADLLDASAMAAACTGVDYVLHEAAIASVPRSVDDPCETNRANVEGTVNLLIAAREAKVKRVIFAASSSVYGDSPALPKHEAMLPNPISPYAVAKLTGEYYMAAFFRCYGLETVSLRYFNVFGPRQDANSDYSGVLAKFSRLMLAGEQPTIYGDGEQSRDFTYIDNVVSANLRACQAPAERVCGRVFNVATGRQFTLNETFRLLQAITGYGSEPRYAAVRAGDVNHSFGDITLSRQCLGYEPVVNFKEGLRRTIVWYRSSLSTVAAS